MEGYQVHRWGADPVWQELPDPTAPGADEVLIEVEACSVGRTVLNCINGNLSDDPELLPRVPGHELIGRVIEAGSGASTLVGQRVAAYFYLFCGTCPACTAGQEPRCANLAGWVGVHRDGGYAQKAKLAARNAVPMPEELDPVAATVVPDAVATPVHVVNRAGIGSGDRVIVFGAGGGLGIHMIQVAGHAGATVAGFDIDDAKLAEIERLGSIPVQSGELSTVDPRSVFSDGEPTVIIDFLGTKESTRWAIDGLGMGGRHVALTTFPGREVPVTPKELVFRELSLFGSRYAYRSELTEAARLVATGAIEPIIGMVGGPEAVPDMHDQLRAQTLLGRGALDWSQS